MIVSRWELFYKLLGEKYIRGGQISRVYQLVMLCLLISFLATRMPYCFSVGLTVGCIVVFVLPVYLSLFKSRFTGNPLSSFYSQFAAEGIPLWMVPVLCTAESTSYLIRPAMLMARPTINICLGHFALMALWMQSDDVSTLTCVALVFVLFAYEFFVIFVQWFIVGSILEFTRFE